MRYLDTANFRSLPVTVSEKNQEVLNIRKNSFNQHRVNVLGICFRTLQQKKIRAISDNI